MSRRGTMKRKIVEDEVFDISFLGNWSASTRFKEYFEFVQADGTINTTATVATKKYRFKEGQEGFPDGQGINWMFFGMDVLESISLPPSMGLATLADNGIRRCPNLKSVILPLDWGAMIKISEMFAECPNLVSVALLADMESFIYGYSNIFRATGFTSKGAGIKLAEGYYMSPADGVFPIECWKRGMGIDDLLTI